ncbi:MAG: hypothetical protein ACK4VN_01690 [Bacteroidales bacterium]
MYRLQKAIISAALCAFTMVSPLLAQFYSAGQDPASVEWKQINTQNFQVIFPEEYTEEATYIADILEYSYNWASFSLDHSPRRISVIVHNQTVISNGFVSWAPRRIELFTNPPANNDTHPWMESLVLHEFRHVVQIDKLNQGITRLLGYVFGEQAAGAILGLYVPLWFLEGDAVAIETAMTHSGRGRLPAFEQGLRAQVLAYGPYSFDKAVFGSYKDHVPNHYELGYQLVASARAEHGADVWSEPLRRVARRPWSITPFSNGIKKSTGRSKTQHYEHTFAMLDSLWKVQMSSQIYTPAQRLNRNNKLYTSYHHPWWINDSTVIALRTGLRDIPHVVKIHAGGVEETLFAPGGFFPYGFHYAAGRLVWSQPSPDPRWEHRNFANIVVYDLERGRRRIITRQGSYFAPALSPDGERIAAVQTNPQSRYSLVILDAHTGAEQYSFAYPGNDFIMQPSWHPDGEHVVMIALNEQGKRIDLLNLEHSSVATLLPSTHQEIAAPRFHGQTLVFNGTWTGTDNIYRINPESNQVELIVSAPFGAVNGSLSPSGHAIAFSSYTAKGYDIQASLMENLMPEPQSQLQDYSVGFHRQLAQQEKAIIARDNIPRREHQIEPYDKRRNLFHLHSWAPAYVDAFGQTADLGASVQFQNMLSTSFATLGYLWDREQQTGKTSIVYSYQGWYPVLDFLAENGSERAFYVYEDSGVQSVRSFLYGQNNVRLSASVPLRFQRHEYFFGITPWVRIGINRAGNNRHTPDRIMVSPNRYFELENQTYYMQEYRLLTFRQRRSVARDIYPRSAQILDISYRHSPLGTYNMGSVFAARGILFMPMPTRHEGLRLSAAYQKRTAGNYKQNTIRYNWGSAVAYPRGYTLQNHEELKAFTIDYVLPFWYADLSIPPVLYLKRLRGHLFADYALATRFPNPNNPQQDLAETLSSVGYGLTADLHLFRFFAPLSLGFEVAFPAQGDISINLITGVRF